MFFFDESMQINTFMVMGKALLGSSDMLPHRSGDIVDWLRR